MRPFAAAHDNKDRSLGLSDVATGTHRRSADTTTESYRKSKLLAVHKMFDVDKSGFVDANDLLALGKVRNETLDTVPAAFVADPNRDT